jgi:hypothetical protein
MLRSGKLDGLSWLSLEEVAHVDTRKALIGGHVLPIEVNDSKFRCERTYIKTPDYREHVFVREAYADDFSLLLKLPR